MDEQENNNSVASDLPIESIIETTDKVIQSSNESIIVSLQDTTLKVLEDTTIQKPGQEKQPLVNNEDRNLNEEANEVEEVEEEEVSFVPTQKPINKSLIQSLNSGS